MPVKIGRLLRYLLESYIFVILVSLVVGLMFSARVVALAPYSTLFLQVIFFLSSLKMDAAEVMKEAKDLRLLALVNVVKLIILPAAVYVVAVRVSPAMAVPLLLLAAMPPGMTSPLLAEVAGGKQGLALIITVTASLLAPVTVPAVVSFFARTAVTVSAFTMFVNLASVIVVPFILAQIVRRFWHRRLETTYFAFKPISIVLLGLLIAGVVAKQARIITTQNWIVAAGLMAVLFLLGGLMMTASYNLVWWRQCGDRLTVAVSMSFLNFSLAIYLAGAFFKDPGVLLAAVMVIFPWALLLWPFKYIVRKFVCPIKATP